MARKPTPKKNGRSRKKAQPRGSTSRKRAGKKSDESASADNGTGDNRIEYVSISQETRRRYLNYAMSVIQSRALPDARDGLKPVQRRILYAMYHDLHLSPTTKPRKSMKICGDTTGNYHPHGETAVYEALVRMAQDFTLRFPLVNGQGNFGSVMGMGAAAARYTEARLTPVAEHLMQELRYQTVDMRLNYDATRSEPIVLPAQFPNLLVNGTQGIAVGMATSIPPHNLVEVIKACIHLIANPKATTGKLMFYIKSPDFPLGGRIVSDKKALREAYKSGRGSIKLRGEWKSGSDKRKNSAGRIVIHSVPYGVATDALKTEIGQIIADRKLPQLLDLIDETSDDSGLSIVLETRPDADPEAVMAYLYKHTPLEQNISYNATALVPDSSGGLVPRRLGLGELLRCFNDFRFETVRRRYEFQLEQLRKRIYILEGFEIIFEGLDKALKLIRRSNGKADAAKKLMKAFPLDEIQTYAILELQLYRISKLEINGIRKELEEKRGEAAEIENLLKSPRQLWAVVKKELLEVAAEFGDQRRTSLGSTDEITEFDAQAYIVRENTNVVVTHDGWVKRVGRLTKVESTRVREGDSVLSVVPASTLDNVVILSSDGTAYTLSTDQVPASSGYGDPLSKHVKLADGVHIVNAITTDPRFIPEDANVRGEATPAPYLLIVTARGQVMRFSFSSFRAPSTRNGRRYCRLNPGDHVAYADLVDSGKTLFIVSRDARLIHFRVRDVPVLAGPGKGVRGLKLEDRDEVLGAMQLTRPSDALRIRNINDKVLSFGQTKYTVTSRGGRGVKTSQRTGFAEIVRPEIDLVDWTEYESE
ncbi:MAG: DNA topoisomerase (ATP-hydrolyzing) [Planctomycetaceae bacterium]